MTSAQRVLSGPNSAIEQGFHDIRAFDQNNESKIEVSKKNVDQAVNRLVYSLIFLVTAPMFGQFLFISMRKARMAAGVSVFIGLALIVFFGLRWRAAEKALSSGTELDLDDNLYLGLERFHTFLQNDCQDKTTYHYEIDFRTIKLAEFRKSSRSISGGFEAKHLQSKLKGRVKLRDGTLFEFQTFEKAKIKVRTRKNSRGKTKTKHKVKIKDLYTVRVRLPEGTTNEASSLGKPAQANFLRSNKPVKFKRRDNRAFASFEKSREPNEKFDVEPLLQLAVYAFAQ